MVRVLAFSLLAQTGCSLVLDFSNSAIPIDASPFTEDECAFGEPNDTFDDASVIAATAIGPGAICARGFDDRDFYKLAVPAGTTAITVEIAFLHASGDLDLFLYNAASQQQALSAGAQDNEKIVCPAMTPRCALGDTVPIDEGDYVIEVRGALPGTQNRYDIAITLQ
jgi:hypothetical protein